MLRLVPSLKAPLGDRLVQAFTGTRSPWFRRARLSRRLCRHCLVLGRLWEADEHNEIHQLLRRDIATHVTLADPFGAAELVGQLRAVNAHTQADMLAARLSAAGWFSVLVHTSNDVRIRFCFGRNLRSARQPSLDRSCPPFRGGEIPGWLGGEPSHHDQTRSPQPKPLSCLLTPYLGFGHPRRRPVNRACRSARQRRASRWARTSTRERRSVISTA